MTENLLPNYYQKIAVPVGILALISLIFNYILSDFTALEQARLAWIIKCIFLISLAVFSFSKEKNESGKIRMLRLRGLRDAVGFGVFVILLDAISELIFWKNDFEIKNAYEIMLMILIYHLVFFHYRKRKFK